MKISKNKKGAGEYALLGLILFLVLAGMVFSETNLSDKEFVGKIQYQVLQANERTQMVQQYITAAASYSAKFAVTDLFKFAGIFQEQSDTGEALNPPCGSYQYSLYSNKGKNCTPDYKASYSSFFQEIMASYLHKYEELPIFFVYDLDFKENFQKNEVRLLGNSLNKLKMYVFEKPSEEDLTIFESELGGYGNEKTIPCTTGKCFSDIANYYLSLYSNNGNSLPYVWGGESPYPYEDTVKLKTKEGSFFNGVSMDKYQPEPHQTELTVPGFDCSGWVWWVAKHAQIKGFEKRLSADGYYRLAKSTAKEICSYDKGPCPSGDCEFSAGPCYSQTIFQQARPGDILFYGSPNNVTHIMIYDGYGFIVHSVGSKGLVREKLRTSYASETTTKIVGVYRFDYANKGFDSLNEYLSKKEPDISNITINNNTNNNDTNKSIKKTEKSKPNNSQVSLLGPVDWCDGSEKLPKGTYANRIKHEAWNSEGKTYYDIAVNTGLEEGVDPALIVTHMIYETSMGSDDSCTSKGYSSLTGCGWSGTCVSDCNCGGMSTNSDKNQLSCTARTDKEAYLEAVTGNNEVVGDYQNCKEYQGDSEKFWTCILCIYQGDYDHVVPGSSGKTYFTKDGTCQYAENFKKTYCSWRKFFDQKGYAASSISKSKGKLSNSYIKYTPYIDTNITMNFADLEYIKDFVEETQKDCKDNLRVCVAKKLSKFNTNNPKVNLTMNKEDDAIARDLADQLFDCHLNEQKSCICPLTINLSLNSMKEDKFSIYMNEDWMMYLGTEGWFSFSIDDAKKITRLPFYPTSAFTPEKDGHDYVEFLIDKKDISNNKFDAEDAVLKGGDYKWDLGLEDGRSDVALKKTDQIKYDWMQYKPEDRNTWQECRDNKRYFRFQARFGFTNKTLKFSLYLEDSKAPEINLYKLEQSSCINQPIIKMAWSVSKNSDKPYDFIIERQGEQKAYQVLEANAEEKNITTKPALYQLYKEEKATKIIYYYLINESPEGKAFEINKTYSFSLTVRDHYLNTKKSSIQQIKINESSENKVLDAVGLGSVALTLESLKEFIPEGICLNTYHRVVNFKNNSIKSWEAKGSLGTNQIINFDSDKGINITNLEVYKGITNPQTGEQLYWIKNIPNVICDESDTTVGKICAANPSLIKQLYLLSAEVLVPQNKILKINQAFRTYEIQEDLWKKNNKNSSLACDPNKKICPHMIAGAIDIRIKENDINIADDKEEKIMCDYGFVRYRGEPWHFEYGTNRWIEAEEKRKLGKRVCTYG